MSHLLAVDRLPYRVLAGWVALVRAGLIWVLLCLPIVTAPAATVVLLHTVGQILSGHSPPTLAGSWRMVRAYFAPGLRLAALIALGSAIAASAILGPSPGGVWSMVLPYVVLPVAATWVLACQWCFVLLHERRDGALAALRASYIRAMRRPDLAAASALGTAALPIVGLYIPSSISLPFWLSVPAIWASLATATCRWAAPRTVGDASSSSARRFPDEDQ